MARKIGYLKDILKPSSTLTHGIIQLLFDTNHDNAWGGQYDPKNDFIITLGKKSDYILMKSTENTIVIQLCTARVKDDKITALNTEYTFVIKYKEQQIPVYDSEY